MRLSRATSWPSSSVHHARAGRESFRFEDLAFSSVESVGSDLKAPSPSQMDTFAASQRGGRARRALFVIKVT